MNLVNGIFSYIFQGLLAGIALTILTCFLGMKIANRFKLIDVPGVAPHKMHKSPMPYAGGIALALSVIVLSTISGTWLVPEIRMMFIAAAVIFIFGIVDDARRLTPLVKLSGQVLAAVVLVSLGIQIKIFETQTFFIGGNQHIFVWLDRFLTVFWIVGVTNAFNLVDSMDGLAVGLSAWAFTFFTLATVDSGQLQLSIQSAILLGICIGIYYFNAPPARLFIGDSGAQTLGFLLAVTAILYNPVGKFQTSSWLVPILLVGVPIFDTTLVTISRLRRHRPFYSANRDHTYHRLVAMGMDSNRAVLTMHMTGLLLDCIAFIAVSMAPIWANSIFLFCLIAGVTLIYYLDRKQIRP
jgi:UDP-GlcNAc:undecaprenyl-phosphate/decaprenyl-phosphate GlcNAc-1-phosphate transferase